MTDLKEDSTLHNTSDIPSNAVNSLENLDEILKALASLSPVEYDRNRKKSAKDLSIQLKTLDDLVKAARKDNTATQETSLFGSVEVYPDPVDPAELFSDIKRNALTYIIMDQAQACALVLWIAMTWVVDILKVAPLIIINAPEKSCGKSQLLDIIGRLSAKTILSSNMSTSALFRVTDLYSPTILIDEADTFIKENKELNGLINAGHSRVSSYVMRIVGENFEPKQFNVFGPKALAGISLERHLQDSTLSRGIVLNMRRKKSHETVERLRHADKSEFEVIRAKLARFALDYSLQISQARPELPESLSDREQDNWEGLLAIAACAGDGWVASGRHSALYFSSEVTESLSIGTELLIDIESIFTAEDIQKISTVDLISALIGDEERPWATYNRGKPITPRQIALQLGKYDIHSKTVRMSFGKTPKGFDVGQFSDAFSRYTPSDKKLPPQCNEASQASPVIDSSVAEQTQHELQRGGDENVAAEVSRNTTLTATPETLQNMTCGGVADVAANSEAHEEAF